MAAEVIPPAPDHYFNDYAQRRGRQPRRTNSTRNWKTLSVQLATRFGSRFIRRCNPILPLTITPSAWRAPGRLGKKATNNGVILFVFIEDRQMFIQVGYGLEGVAA